MNSAISCWLGGRPSRSRYARRISVWRSARGAAFSPFCSRARSRNKSTGLSSEREATCGRGACAGSLNAQ